MRKLAMAVAALLLCATTSITNAQETNKEPFSVRTNQLSHYLRLTSDQEEMVDNINASFLRTQQNCLSEDSMCLETLMRDAILDNLKSMRNVLTETQYRKYVTILNITNNNNRRFGGIAFSDIYLANNK